MVTELIVACLRLLLKITLLSFAYQVTVLVPYSLWMGAFFFLAFKELFQKIKTVACKITRYRLARLIVFAWNKAVSLGVGISAFESTCIYPFIRNIVPECLFSICDTSETVNYV